jgi:hypothetical protein
MTVPKARALAATAAFALALLAGACSTDGPAPMIPTSTDSGADAQADGGTPDPCTLLTLDEVSAALDEAYAEVKELLPGRLPGQRTCSFTPDSELWGCLTVTECSISTVTLAVWPAQADEVDGFKAEAGQVTDLDGLGEVAFGEPTSVWAFTGSYMVNVRLFSMEVESIDPASSLVRAAVARVVADDASS